MAQQDVTAPVRNNGRIWPQIGLVDGGKPANQGTGFLVGPNHVLTALHVVDGLEQARIVFSNGADVPATVERRIPNCHVTLLRLNPRPNDRIPGPPVKLCRLPDCYPTAYVTWGYRELVQGQLEAFQGSGEVTAILPRVPEQMLQLDTRSQRPGMSGAPLAIATEPDVVVIGFGRGRHKPADIRDIEDLALGHAVEHIPVQDLESIATTVLDYGAKLAPECMQLEAIAKSTKRKRALVRRIRRALEMVVLGLAVADWSEIVASGKATHTVATPLMAVSLVALTIYALLATIAQALRAIHFEVEAIFALYAAPVIDAERRRAIERLLRQSKCAELEPLRRGLDGQSK